LRAWVSCTAQLDLCITAPRIVCEQISLHPETHVQETWRGTRGAMCRIGEEGPVLMGTGDKRIPSAFAAGTRQFSCPASGGKCTSLGGWSSVGRTSTRLHELALGAPNCNVGQGTEGADSTGEVGGGPGTRRHSEDSSGTVNAGLSGGTAGGAGRDSKGADSPVNAGL